MFKVVSTDSMRKIEAAADENGISYDEMMNRAGRAAADRALLILRQFDSPLVTVLVGPGNNGGDGLVTGLCIAQEIATAEVRFYLLKDRGEDDPHMAVVREAGLFHVRAEDDHDKRVLRNMVASADMLIDALFGIGTHLPLREEAAQVLRAARRGILERETARPEVITIDPADGAQVPRPSRLHILAIDGPSGMDFESGELDEAAIHADETVTFIAPKYGQFAFPAAAAIGRLVVSDLGIPRNLKEIKQEKDFLVDGDLVREKLPDRSPDSHKGTFGKAMIVAGSVNYIGAPALAAQASYRAGAGLVTVGAPQSIISALAPGVQEATWVLLPHDMGVLSEAAVDVLAKELADYDSLLLGPGIGQEKATEKFLTALLHRSSGSRPASKRPIGFQHQAEQDENEESAPAIELPGLIIDADGLNLLAKQEKWWELLPEKTIITPHPGEMARLAGLSTAEVQKDRWQIARQKAAEWNVILVLKGAHTLIARPEGETAVLPFKNSGMATAGTGDVLAGLIAGLVAQGVEPFEAAYCGGYIHGVAGEIAVERGDARSTTAGDVLRAVGAALRKIQGSR